MPEISSLPYDLTMPLSLQKTNEKLREEFFALESPPDVATLLELDYSDLLYYLYRKPAEEKYLQFEVAKKRGGTRLVSVPSTGLKIVQQKLLQVLRAVYEPRLCVHGFTTGKSIVTNAESHLGTKYVLNVDISDFFPSINFGRVRGMFMAKPHSLPDKVATVVAQICCFGNQLPQGSPTSPIVANMICSKMDSQLQQLAKQYSCFYTRYADDITFSTQLSIFPPAIAKSITRDATTQAEVGPILQTIISENGFTINSSKIRLQGKRHRQEVTGVTVNRSPNVRRKFVRQIRSMLHAWKVHGLEKAESVFHNEFYKKHELSLIKSKPSFTSVLKGKIDYLKMIRGQNDPIYLKFLNQYNSLLDPTQYTEKLPSLVSSKKVFISYSRTDEEFARKLATSLSSLSANIWIDVNDIPPGKKWSNEIHNGLEECELMLLIVSPESMRSQNVEDEWGYFMGEKKLIIPLILRPAKLNYRLQDLQYIPFHNQSYNDAFEKLSYWLTR
jgi:RNA-directed DNA polymerase